MSSRMIFEKKSTSKANMLSLYEAMLRPRIIEEKMLSLLRQGKISKWFSGIGQEAIAVGCTMALTEDEMIFPMHRNLGVFTTRGIPLRKLLAQWQGAESGFTKGRDRSFHFGTADYNITGMISHLGAQLSLAAGVALAHKLRKQNKIALAFTGEGGTSEGEFHEALNMAAVWQLPVIFVIENNGYGLSTPTSEQYRCTDLADKGIGYGMESHILDGNNVLEVYQTIDRIAKRIRKKPAPVLIECKTFRMRGHEEASGTKYVPKKLMDDWAKKDPIANYEAYLLQQKVLTEDGVTELRKSIKKEIDETVRNSFSNEPIEASSSKELADVFIPSKNAEVAPKKSVKKMRFIDAISDGLETAMKKNKELVLMGQDIAEYGGVFKITDGFWKKFGLDRVRNTPICESAVLGIAMGLSLRGIPSMVEMQFSDFVSCGFNQIVNNIAKVHYRWGAGVNTVIRMPTGGGMAAGPFHSQSTEAWFTHTPGLKIVYPSTPYDAKGLLLASFADPNPVLFFEHKALYRSLEAEVPKSYYTIPIGKARMARTGSECTIITYGQGVIWAEEVVASMGCDAEILDLRTLSPLDYPSIDKSVIKTNRVIILHEDVEFGGIGGELAAYISEHLFEYLDAPVMRSASLNTPIPFAKELEDNYFPKERFKSSLEKLINY